MPSLLVGTDWKRQDAAKAALEAASLIVINGEGTLHHGKRKGFWLLEAGARVKANGGKVALINALWQDNPQDWADIAAGFDLLACRDRRSAAALGEQTAQPVSWLGDLSMYDPHLHSETSRNGVVVSCSVHRDVTSRLADFANETGSNYIPVTTYIKQVNPHLTGLRKIIRTAYANRAERRFLTRHPQTRLLQSDADYMSEISTHALLVTGRFHSVCMAILTRTPFVAVTSNSWKIETLLDDIGLNKSRVKNVDAIGTALFDQDWSWSPDELAAMEDALTKWRASGNAIFDQIAALASR